MSEDIIWREDALDAIDEIESEVADGDGFQYEKWRQWFCDLPTADIDLSDYSDRLWRNAYEQGKADAEPKRKTGKWLDNETSFSDDVPQTCTCSVCRMRSRRPIGDFCKWCGADMRGEQE